MSGAPEIVVPTPPRTQQFVTLDTRYFGPITELMTVQEHGTDRLTITQHPVEAGASVTDHAYVEPADLQLQMMAVNARVGWEVRPGSSDVAYLEVLYAKLLKLQGSRVTFPVQTGKRLYQNMLIASLELTTDEKTEYALMLTIVCREIIKVSTSSVTISDALLQSYPENTAPVADNGTKQPAPATTPLPPTPRPAPPPAPVQITPTTPKSIWESFALPLNPLNPFF